MKTPILIFSTLLALTLPVSVGATTSLDCSIHLKHFTGRIVTKGPNWHDYQILQFLLETNRKVEFLEFNDRHRPLAKLSEILSDVTKQEKLRGLGEFKKVEYWGYSARFGTKKEFRDVFEFQGPQKQVLQIATAVTSKDIDFLQIRSFSAGAQPQHSFGLYDLVPVERIEWKGQVKLVLTPVGLTDIKRFRRGNLSAKDLEETFQILKPLTSFDEVRKNPEEYFETFNAVYEPNFNELSLVLDLLVALDAIEDSVRKEFDQMLARIHIHQNAVNLAYIAKSPLPTFDQFQGLVRMFGKQSKNLVLGDGDLVLRVFPGEPYRIHLVEQEGFSYLLEANQGTRSVFFDPKLDSKGGLKSFKNRVDISPNGAINLEGELNAYALGRLTFPLRLIQVRLLDLP